MTYYFLRFYLFILRERGREKERERNINVQVRHPSAAHIPGMCPDQESNWWPFSFGEDAKSTEPYQLGPGGDLFRNLASPSWAHVTSTHVCCPELSEITPILREAGQCGIAGWPGRTEHIFMVAWNWIAEKEKAHLLCSHIPLLSYSQMYPKLVVSWGTPASEGHPLNGNRLLDHFFHASPYQYDTEQFMKDKGIMHYSSEGVFKYTKISWFPSKEWISNGKVTGLKSKTVR